LSIEPVRVVRDAVELFGEPAADVVGEHLDLDRGPGQIRRGGVPALLHRLAICRTSFPYRAAKTQRGRLAFVADHRHGQR
jgi:hypothetical protein